jgi:hypothetical protein
VTSLGLVELDPAALIPDKIRRLTFCRQNKPLRENMTKSVLVFTAALAGLFSTVAYGQTAYPVTDEEKQYCAYDYRQYCNQDGLGSQLLALCMKQHGKELSPECIKALEDAGEVTPDEEAQLKKRGE